jgi:hypothetical protein
MGHPCPSCGCTCRSVDVGPLLFVVHPGEGTDCLPRLEALFGRGVPGERPSLPPLDVEIAAIVAALTEPASPRRQAQRAGSRRSPKHKTAAEQRTSSLLPPHLQVRSAHAYWTRGGRYVG